MKNTTKKFLMFISTILILINFSINVLAQDNSSISDINNTNIRVKITYLGYDKNWNAEKLRINMTIDRLGHLLYVENYYSIGSEAPKFYSSKAYYDNNLTSNKISFEILRPKTSLGKPYSLIKSTISIDGKMISDKWLDSLKTTQFDIGNISKSSVANTTNVSANKNNTMRPELVNTSPGKNDTKNNTNRTDNITVSRPDTFKKSYIFEIIMIILVGLMIIAVYQTKKK